MTNCRSSVTATLGIDVKLHTTSSLYNVTISHTIHAYTGERERENIVHTKRGDSTLRVRMVEKS